MFSVAVVATWFAAARAAPALDEVVVAPTRVSVGFVDFPGCPVFSGTLTPSDPILDPGCGLVIELVDGVLVAKSDSQTGRLRVADLVADFVVPDGSGAVPVIVGSDGDPLFEDALIGLFGRYGGPVDNRYLHDGFVTHLIGGDEVSASINVILVDDLQPAETKTVLGLIALVADPSSAVSREEFDALAAEVTALAGRIATLEDSDASQSAAIAALQDDTVALSGRLTLVENSDAAQAGEIAELQNQVAELNERADKIEQVPPVRNWLRKMMRALGME
jgi:uncharacterized coiled-coil protein SlyX